MARLKTYSFKEAIRWMVLNDDVEWLKDEQPIISVTGSFISDCYDRSAEEVIEAALKQLAKE